MFTQIPNTYLTKMIVLSVVSIILCTVQIHRRKQVNFLKVCKLSTILPLMSIVIFSLSDAAMIFISLARANAVAVTIIDEGIASILSTISAGLMVTILLSIYYTITAAVYENQKHEKI